MCDKRSSTVYRISPCDRIKFHCVTAGGERSRAPSATRKNCGWYREIIIQRAGKKKEWPGGVRRRR